VPAKYIRVNVRMPHKEIKGYGEINLMKAKIGDVIQFERFGFVRIEKITRDKVFTIFSHE
jgi:glutamyl-tRNA synthetase